MCHVKKFLSSHTYVPSENWTEGGAEILLNYGGCWCGYYVQVHEHRECGLRLRYVRCEKCEAAVVKAAEENMKIVESYIYKWPSDKALPLVIKEMREWSEPRLTGFLMFK